MLDLFSYGEMLLATLSSVGDFLLRSPAPIHATVIGGLASWLYSAGFYDAANWIKSYFYPDISLASLIFGGGVVIFLVTRLVKFFTDIVT